MHVKSYKQLCSLLEIPYKTNTDSKNRQLKELEQFYVLVKDKNGSGFAVQSRKEPILSKTQSRARNGKYNNLMNTLVMHYFMKGYEPKPKGLVLEDLFNTMKFISTKNNKHIKVNPIEEKYNAWVYKLADDAINAKIYDLLSNSLKSLSTSGNIVYSGHYLLKDGAIYQDSDNIIKEVTKELLNEMKVLNEFILKRKSEKFQKAFYTKRNVRLREEYGFEVDSKVLLVDIINKGSFKNLNPLQYKQALTIVYELIRKDLTEKPQNLLDDLKVSEAERIELFHILGFENALYTTEETKDIDDAAKLIEIYNEYIIYDAS